MYEHREERQDGPSLALHCVYRHRGLIAGQLSRLQWTGEDLTLASGFHSD